MKEFWKDARKKARGVFRLELILFGLLFFGAYVVLGFFLDEQIDFVIGVMRGHAVLGAVFYILFFAASIFFVPLSSIPLVLFTGAIWGTFWGGTLSALGWWLGGIILFLFARYAGRPFLSRFFSFEKMDEWEKRVPKNITFTGIIFTHMVLPTEIPSFAFGLTKKIKLTTYALASVFGIFPMSYLLVATGGALFSKDWSLTVLLGIFFVLFFMLAYFIWKKFYLE